MKNPYTLAAIIGTTLGSLTPLSAEVDILSEPLGFNSVPCPVLSSTILGVPFRPNGSQQGVLASAPTDNGNDTATLTLAGTPNFTVDEFASGANYTHYAKFTSNALDGRVFPITANTANELTIFLNGDSVSGGALNDTLVIAAYWTLDALFPPAGATTSWAENPPSSGNWEPNGHAVVASANPFARETEILLPDLAGQGELLSPKDTFYLWDGIWRKFGDLTYSDVGDTLIYPDTYFILRHPSNVDHGTTFQCSGEVELGKMDIPLSTLTTGRQENFVAIPRPVDVTLDDLGLVPGAFEASPNPFARTDELLVFDNDQQVFLKSPSATYYYWNGNWYLFGDLTYTPVGSTAVIPAGTGFMIRKAATATGTTVFWENSATYSNDP